MKYVAYVCICGVSAYCPLNQQIQWNVGCTSGDATKTGHCTTVFLQKLSLPQEIASICGWPKISTGWTHQSSCINKLSTEKCMLNSMWQDLWCINHKSWISLLISWILRVSHAIRLMDRPFQRTLGNCWGTTHRNRREVNMFFHHQPIILVGGKTTPLKNHGVRQLGWWHSIPNIFLLLVYSLLKSLFISLLTTMVTRNVHK
jgi:hypothetical protein